MSCSPRESRLRWWRKLRTLSLAQTDNPFGIIHVVTIPCCNLYNRCKGHYSLLKQTDIICTTFSSPFLVSVSPWRFFFLLLGDLTCPSPFFSLSHGLIAPTLDYPNTSSKSNMKNTYNVHIILCITKLPKFCTTVTFIHSSNLKSYYS